MVTMMKAARLMRGLRQWDLAAATGISAGWICKIERGEVQPRPWMLEAIAHVLGVPPDRLLEPVPQGPRREPVGALLAGEEAG